jgi:aspartate beta-hydroxylase
MQQKDLMAIRTIETELDRAQRGGQEAVAAALLERLHAADPDHPRALLALGQRAFRGGDLQRAHALLGRLVEVDGKDQQQWINLSVVCQAMGDEQGEEDALRGALTVDPGDLLALILRGNLFERQGKKHAAAQAFGAAATVAPSLDKLNPQLRPAVQHARAFREQYDKDFGAYVDQYLEPYFKDMAGEQLGRFRESVDIMLGRKQRYDSKSMLYHVPGLAPIAFFERAEFAWLDPIEAATDAIRAEFVALNADDDSFVPYLNYSSDMPLNQWAELNNSQRWSAFHLIEKGGVVEKNASRCPQTMAALAHAPQPDQPGRTPSAMFSLLKPHTHIPPHVGVSNARLVVHLPLILPEKCRFRVGNDTREWEMGSAMVFDDTIEHEAWNDSDHLRVNLIFDIWHPHLSAAEREMIKAMTKGVNAFTQSSGGFEL